MSWNDTLITDSADKACWDLLGFGAEQLDKRHDNRLDKIVSEGEAYTTFRYGNTRILYAIVDRASGNGLKLNAVWREEETYEEGELD